MWSAAIETPRLTESVLTHLCEALVRINVDHLRADRSIPPLYEAGVRYRQEPRGAETWLDIPRVRARRAGDCEDLVAWRVAELRVQGESAAEAVGLWQRTPTGVLVHVQVRRADGRIEDPSRALGMP